jgi:uncharacterized membrane protein
MILKLRLEKDSAVEVGQVVNRFFHWRWIKVYWLKPCFVTMFLFYTLKVLKES